MKALLLVIILSAPLSAAPVWSGDTLAEFSAWKSDRIRSGELTLDVSLRYTEAIHTIEKFSRLVREYASDDPEHQRYVVSVIRGKEISEIERVTALYNLSIAKIEHVEAVGVAVANERLFAAAVGDDKVRYQKLSHSSSELVAESELKLRKAQDEFEKRK
jgi:hypothetical protein